LRGLIDSILSMTATIFYILALGLFGLGLLLLRHTSPYSREGGSRFEWQMRRRTIGEILILASFLALGLAVVNQIFPRSVPDVLTTKEAPAR
jgi:hypothetical protein